MLKSALLLGAGIAIGAGAIQGLSAATGPAVYTVYEANVTDEAAYAKALPDVQKMIKENGGSYVAGGFNKTKLVSGLPVGNRYVIVRWEDNMSAFDRAEDDGIRAWIEKNAPEARQIVVEAAGVK
jgi:uncharacterized protein (DUF1330 family)